MLRSYSPQSLAKFRHNLVEFGWNLPFWANKMLVTLGAPQAQLRGCRGEHVLLAFLRSRHRVVGGS